MEFESKSNSSFKQKKDDIMQVEDGDEQSSKKQNKRKKAPVLSHTQKEIDKQN